MKLIRPRLRAHQMRPQDDPKDLMAGEGQAVSCEGHAITAALNPRKHSDCHDVARESVTQPALDEINLSDVTAIDLNT